MDCDYKEYELFVQKLFQAIIYAGENGIQKNIKVEHDKKILDNAGIERQFDIYWKYELAGIEYETIIECKNYSSKVTVERIDALIGKLHDLPNIKGIFATTQGYQAGAVKKAEQNNIELLVVRKEKDDDWMDEDGNPLIKKIIINMIALSRPRITKLNIYIKKEDIDNSQQIDFATPSMVLDKEVTIVDKYNKEEYSIYDGAVKNKFHLDLQDNKTYGDIHTKEIIFEDAYYKRKGMWQKIHKLKIEYVIDKPVEQEVVVEMFIDGVVEYLFKRKKSFVTRDGRVFHRQ